MGLESSLMNVGKCSFTSGQDGNGSSSGRIQRGALKSSVESAMMMVQAATKMRAATLSFAITSSPVVIGRVAANELSPSRADQKSVLATLPPRDEATTRSE